MLNNLVRYYMVLQQLEHLVLACKTKLYSAKTADIALRYLMTAAVTQPNIFLLNENEREIQFGHI